VGCDLFKRFVYHSYISIFLLRLPKCKKHLESKQCCANHSFKVDGLEELDAISLIDV
jgi:hypothetical protein